ncbi:MAG: amidohydrolase [Sterolibacterium sp.]|jgi:predicted TIM-barrel fold metal-dependent hydrolase|nr:amidohydrolase [Sterolibacterium sp.]
MAKTAKDYFIAMTEFHFMNLQTMSEIDYYPNVQRWWGSVDGVMRAWSGRDLTGEWPQPIASALITEMDKTNVDVAFCLREPMMDVTGGVVSLSTNGFMLQQIAPYPERMYLEANVGPVIKRGIKEANWELEFLFKEKGAKLCKLYTPEDDGPLNDKRLWPFYEKAQELGITLTVHTGFSYVVPQPSSHCQVGQLDDVLLDFPDLKIIAYHAGWPQSEELIGLCGKHRNLYMSLSGIIGWYQRAPYRGYHAIGTALQWMPADKIVLGFDLPFDDLSRVVNYIVNFDMPAELQEKWGYQQLTEEDKAKILGLNLAKLTGIEPVKRKQGGYKIPAPATGHGH